MRRISKHQGEILCKGDTTKVCLSIYLPATQVEYELALAGLGKGGGDRLEKYRQTMSQKGLSKNELSPPRLAIALGPAVMKAIKRMLGEGCRPEAFDVDKRVADAMREYGGEIATVYAVGNRDVFMSADTVYGDILRYLWSLSGGRAILEGRELAGVYGNGGASWFESASFGEMVLGTPVYIQQYNKRLGVYTGVYLGIFDESWLEGEKDGGYHLSISFVSSKFPDERLPYYVTVRVFGGDAPADVLKRIGKSCIMKKYACYGEVMMDVLFHAFGVLNARRNGVEVLAQEKAACITIVGRTENKFE